MKGKLLLSAPERAPAKLATVLVFATSIATKQQARLVARHLSGVAGVAKWNFDLEDCDRILRIESATLEPECIIALLDSVGFECKELPD